MGTAVEDHVTRVAVRPAAGVPFDWLSVFVLMHAISPLPVSPRRRASFASYHFIVIIQSKNKNATD